MVSALILLIACTIALPLILWALWALVLVPLQVAYSEGISLPAAFRRVWGK